MAAKVFFLFVAVLVLFEAEAAFYRREFFDPGSPFMRGKEHSAGHEHHNIQLNLHCCVTKSKKNH